jgi:PST family polysaccharide transporter
MFEEAIQEKKTVLTNFLALGILQGTNFLIPLIIMPYLNVKIGIEGYGFISFIQAIMVYFSSFTDYGFNVSATREIAINKNDTQKISKIFNRVLSTKAVLCFFSALILFGMILFIPKLTSNYLAYTLGFSIVLGQTILPVWFFQGMEKMKYLTCLNLFSKILFTALIFVFVKRPEDSALVLLFFGLGNLASGIAGVYLAVRQFNLSISIVPMREIKNEIVDGWNLFIANFSVIIYINSNLFILGLFTNDLIVGYYSIAEKISLAMRQILVIFSQAIFPQICKLAIESHLKIIKFYKQFYVPFIVVFSLFCFLVFIFSDFLVFILTQKSESSISNLLKLLCTVPLIVGLNIPAYQILLAHRFQKSCSLILTAGSILNIVLNILLAINLGAIGTAYSVIITELFITFGLHLILHFRHRSENIFSKI